MQNNYIMIQDFMVRDMGLSSNELLVYAIIFGFSQDSETEFYGNQNYIAERIGSSKASVKRALNSLVNKNLILKRTEVISHITKCFYRVNHGILNGDDMIVETKSVEKVLEERGQNAPGGGVKMTLGAGSKCTRERGQNEPHIYNIYNNTENTNNKIKDKKQYIWRNGKQKPESDFLKIGEYGNIRLTLEECDKLRDYYDDRELLVLAINKFERDLQNPNSSAAKRESKKPNHYLSLRDYKNYVKSNPVNTREWVKEQLDKKIHFPAAIQVREMIKENSI